MATKKSDSFADQIVTAIGESVFALFTKGAAEHTNGVSKPVARSPRKPRQEPPPVRTESAEAQKPIESVRADTAGAPTLGKSEMAYVHRTALLLTMGKRADAEDIAQLALLKAYRNLARFRHEASMTSWLYRITFNVFLDYCRRNKKRGEFDEFDERLDGVLIDPAPSVGHNPEEVMSRAQLGHQLYAALEKLSEKHRRVFLLREQDGLSYSEIAVEVGISEGTVMSRLFHARNQLRLLLQD